MAQIRQNLLQGELDTLLEDDDTTMSSPELADMVAVAGADRARIVLNPTFEGGLDPEIVEVTAHTASATTATITRAFEDGTRFPAQEYPVGTKWILTDTVGSSNTHFVEAAGDTMTGPLLLPNGSTSNPALSFAGDDNTGIYHTGTGDTLAIVTGGTARITASSTELSTSLIPGSQSLHSAGKRFIDSITNSVGAFSSITTVATTTSATYYAGRYYRLRYWLNSACNTTNARANITLSFASGSFSWGPQPIIHHQANGASVSTWMGEFYFYLSSGSTATTVVNVRYELRDGGGTIQTYNASVAGLLEVRDEGPINAW